MELLFGFTEGSLELLAHEIEACFGTPAERHDSLWRGGDYYRFKVDSDTIILQRNNDGGPSEEATEEAFAAYSFLLYVSTAKSQRDFSLSPNWYVPRRFRSSVVVATS
jgi:hypothetical protein